MKAAFQNFLIYFRAVGTIQESIHLSQKRMTWISSIFLGHPDENVPFCSFYYSLATK